MILVVLGMKNGFFIVSYTFCVWYNETVNPVVSCLSRRQSPCENVAQAYMFSFPQRLAMPPQQRGALAHTTSWPIGRTEARPSPWPCWVVREWEAESHCLTDSKRGISLHSYQARWHRGGEAEDWLKKPVAIWWEQNFNPLLCAAGPGKKGGCAPLTSPNPTAFF